jgi:S1-C subfamily serine protease
MKLVIRYLGLVILRRELQPGEYSIGRAEDNDIQLSQDFVSRRHAKVYFADGQWFYQDLREGHPNYREEPQSFSTDRPIELEDGLQLLTEELLFESSTQLLGADAVEGIAPRSRPGRRRAVYAIGACAAALLTAVIVCLAFFARQPMDPNALLAFVRPKVVEFEFVPEQKLLAQLKRYAGVGEDELMETSGFCTGFIVAPNVVLTAFHCLRGDSVAEAITRFRIKAHDGRLTSPARVLGFDSTRDYLFLEAPDLTRYGYLDLSEGYEIGQKVYTVGNVEGMGIAIREGLMASTTQDPNHPDVDYLRYSAAASPGNSGGPLVDEYGNVLGLVFAGSASENYNLATSARYLQEGRLRFVADQEPKQVAIDTGRMLGYHFENLLQLLSFPTPMAWYQNPEYARPFEGFSVEVTVPSDLAAFATELASKFNETVGSIYEEALESMGEAGEREGRWRDFSSERTPLLVPVDAASGVTSYLEHENRILPTELRVRTPGSRSEYKSMLKTLEDYGRYRLPTNVHGAERVSGDHSRGSAATLRYRTYPGGKTSPTVFQMPQVQGVLYYGDETGEKPGEIESDTVMSRLLGSEGMLCDTYGVPYVRPKSRRIFTVKEFEGEHRRHQARDRLDREWTAFEWDFIGQLLESYCLDMPQGNLCLSFASPRSQEVMSRLRRENYVKHWLSKLIVDPIFWETEKLMDYLDAEGVRYDPALEDIEIERSEDGRLELAFRALNLSFDFEEEGSPSMLRIFGGLYGQDGESAKWIAVGFEGYWPETNGHICGAGVEWKEHPYSGVLRYVREAEEERERHPRAERREGERGPEITTVEEHLLGGTLPVTIFSYCGPLEKKEERKTLEFEGSELRPHPIHYTVH